MLRQNVPLTPGSWAAGPPTALPGSLCPLAARAQTAAFGSMTSRPPFPDFVNIYWCQEHALRWALARQK